MAKFKAPYELVVLEWEDIRTEYGWQHPAYVLESQPAKCVSVGFLLEKDAAQVILCSGYCNDHDLIDVTSFPIGAVRKITYVSSVKKIPAKKV